MIGLGIGLGLGFSMHDVCTNYVSRGYSTTTRAQLYGLEGRLQGSG